MTETLVQSGRDQNASEVMREGLRIVERREADEAAKLDKLRTAALLGVAAIELGTFKNSSECSRL